MKKTALQSLVTFLIYFLAFGSPIQAQEACFDLNKAVLCVGETIEVSDCSGSPSIGYIYIRESLSQSVGDFELVSDTRHIYDTPGTFYLTQVVQNASTMEASILAREIIVLPTPKPSFSYTLCANRGLNLSISDTNYEEYLINWGDGSPIQAVPQGASDIRHNYALGGSYSLTVQGNYLPGNCGADSTVLIQPIIDIQRPLVSSLSNLVLDNPLGRINLQLEVDSNFTYRVRQAGNPDILEELSGASGLVNFVIDGLNTRDNPPCFQIEAVDACGNSAARDFVYCPIGLEVRAEDSQNIINWNPYPNISSEFSDAFQQYVLYRNDQALQIFRNRSELSYVDTDIDCQVEYCYRVEAQFSSASLNFQAISNTACALAFSSELPQAVAQLNSTVLGSRSIRLFWEVDNDPPIVEYQVFRDGERFVSVSPENQALDTDLNLNRAFCYQVQYRNECDNESPISGITCPVFLEVRPSNQNAPQLNWSAYRNSDNRFESYVIEKIDESGQVYQEIFLSPSQGLQFIDTQAAEDRQVIRYRIRTEINSSEGIVSYSNIVQYEQEFQIFFPNAFSPNGDQLNDFFFPKVNTFFVREFRMLIFNRAGEIMFESKEVNEGWDGSFKGQIAPSGAYVYYVEAKDFRGQDFVQRGTFTLIP